MGKQITFTFFFFFKGQEFIISDWTICRTGLRSFAIILSRSEMPLIGPALSLYQHFSTRLNSCSKPRNGAGFTPGTTYDCVVNIHANPGDLPAFSL